MALLLRSLPHRIHFMRETGIIEHIYNAWEDENLLQSVAKVVCLIVPRGLWAAGFDANGQVLTVHYAGYGAHKPVWRLDFFEQLLSSHPLFTRRELVTNVSFGGSKFLLTPQELFTDESAADWLTKLFVVEPREQVVSAQIADSPLFVTAAYPAGFVELVNINFPSATTNTFVSTMLTASTHAGYTLQCCVADTHAYLVLHLSGKLLWYKVIDCDGGADIAYEVLHYCTVHAIQPSSVSLLASALTDNGFDYLNEMTQFLPNLRDVTGKELIHRWQPVIELANRLYTCA